jgi:hypothetical protein
MTGAPADPDVQALRKLNEQLIEMEQRANNAANDEKEVDKDVIDFFDKIIPDDLSFRTGGRAFISGMGYKKRLYDKNNVTGRKQNILEILTREGSVDGERDRAVVTALVWSEHKDGVQCWRNIRHFRKTESGVWQIDFWYNYDVTALVTYVP